MDARDSSHQTATVQLIVSAPDGDPSRCEIAIKQHFAAEQMNRHTGTQRLVNAINRAERKTWPAIAQNDRRDRDVNVIDTTGL